MVAFRAPPSQRVGDVALTLLVLPFAGVALYFGAMVVVLIGAALVGRQELPDRWVNAIAASMVLCGLAALAHSRLAPWTIRLCPGELELTGPLWHRRLPYETIRFVQAGAPHQWQGGSWTPGVVALNLETDDERFTVHLRPADADACLAAVHARADRAAAVDTAGRESLPRDPGAQRAAVRRLSRFWSRAGWVAVAAGVAGLLAMAVDVMGAVAGRVPLGAGLRALAYAATFLALAAFGWRGVVRGRPGRPRRMKT